MPYIFGKGHCTNDYSLSTMTDLISAMATGSSSRDTACGASTVTNPVTDKRNLASCSFVSRMRNF